MTSLQYNRAAPDFSLPATGGKTVALSDFKGKADVVLVFYCYDFGSI
ncbi:MAG: redoxin domain-containing protein [Candidatus Rokubacteria bacterium]|nr:redoxin domain-containing protein [Candidatus Rokubacteria bacterium]